MSETWMLWDGWKGLVGWLWYGGVVGEEGALRGEVGRRRSSRRRRRRQRRCVPVWMSGLVSGCSVCITPPGGTVPLRIGAEFRRCLIQPHCCCLLARPCLTVCLVGISRRQHRCFPSRPLSASLQPSVCPSPRFAAPLSLPCVCTPDPSQQQLSSSQKAHARTSLQTQLANTDTQQWLSSCDLSSGRVCRVRAYTSVNKRCMHRKGREMPDSLTITQSDS
jgi:hypothetical protein